MAASHSTVEIKLSRHENNQNDSEGVISSHNSAEEKKSGYTSSNIAFPGDASHVAICALSKDRLAILDREDKLHIVNCNNGRIKSTHQIQNLLPNYRYLHAFPDGKILITTGDTTTHQKTVGYDEKTKTQTDLGNLNLCTFPIPYLQPNVVHIQEQIILRPFDGQTFVLCSYSFDPFNFRTLVPINMPKAISAYNFIEDFFVVADFDQRFHIINAKALKQNDWDRNYPPRVIPIKHIYCVNYILPLAEGRFLTKCQNGIGLFQIDQNGIQQLNFIHYEKFENNLPFVRMGSIFTFPNSISHFATWNADLSDPGHLIIWETNSLKPVQVIQIPPGVYEVIPVSDTQIALRYRDRDGLEILRCDSLLEAHNELVKGLLGGTPLCRNIIGIVMDYSRDLPTSGKEYSVERFFKPKMEAIPSVHAAAGPVNPHALEEEPPVSFLDRMKNCFSRM